MEHVFSSKTIHIKPQSAVQPIVFAIFTVEMDLTLQIGTHGGQETLRGLKMSMLLINMSIKLSMTMLLPYNKYDLIN